MADAILGFTLNTANVGGFTQAFSGTVAGVSRAFDYERISITHRLSAASTADLYVRGFTPAEFSEVRLYNGGSGGEILFAGHAVATEFEPVARVGDDPWWHLRCQDYTWLMNRYKRVTATYDGIGVNTCLNRILASFTDGGFRVGYVSSALGNVSQLRFADASVTDAVNRLAEAADAFWDVDGDKRVHIFATPDHMNGGGITISEANNNFAHFSYSRDGQDIANRVYVNGAGSVTTAAAVAGASTLSLEDVGPFLGSGTRQAIVNDMRITFTGVSTTVIGPGDLTGVSGITTDIALGDEVRVTAMAEDTTEQTALAALLGGGLSGVAEITVDAPLANVTEAAAIAAAALARRKYSFKGATFDMYDGVHLTTRRAWPGQTVTVSLSSPLTVSETMRVQEVQFTPRTKLDTSSFRFSRRIKVGPYTRSYALDNAIQGAWRYL